VPGYRSGRGLGGGQAGGDFAVHDHPPMRHATTPMAVELIARKPG
jgi:hypothetical protein